MAFRLYTICFRLFRVNSHTHTHTRNTAWPVDHNQLLYNSACNTTQLNFNTISNIKSHFNSKNLTHSLQFNCIYSLQMTWQVCAFIWTHFCFQLCALLPSFIQHNSVFLMELRDHFALKVSIMRAFIRVTFKILEVMIPNSVFCRSKPKHADLRETNYYMK